MGFLPDDLVALINDSKGKEASQRLDIFRKLAKHVSLIPVRGGMPKEDENPRIYKAPVEPSWQRWCIERRPFDPIIFSPERAGITCGPTNGVLVLDIDDWEKFEVWLKSIGQVIDATKTFMVQSRANRGHIYYKYPTDGNEYGNKSNKPAGFDVRGLGGYVICPGSLHPETGEIYKIHTNGKLNDAPQWLLDYVLKNIKETDGNAKDDVSITDQFIDSLPISREQKLNILNTEPNDDRSVKSMEVMIALHSNGIDDDTIKKIYENYPIGDKIRENKNSEWLTRELDKAKLYVSENKIASVQNKANKNENFSKITIYNALDVVNRSIDFEFMIENVWPKGEPLLITGVGGSGKSLMTLQIAMDLINPPTNGFLGRYTVNMRNKIPRILFIQSENPFTGMKKRIATIRDPQSDYTIDDSMFKDHIFFAGMGNDITITGNIEDRLFIHKLSEAVDEVKADIIVIDPLISFHQKDENSNDQMRKVLDILTEFCREKNVTPLLVHHHGKMANESGQGGGRGASAIGDWSPNTWELSKKKDSFTFSPKKTRNYTAPEEIQLELHYLRFRPLAGAGVDDKSVLVLQALKNNSGKFDTQKAFVSTIAQILKDQEESVPVENTIRGWIASAVKNGLVSESKRGNKVSYSLNKDATKKAKKNK